MKRLFFICITIILLSSTTPNIASTQVTAPAKQSENELIKSTIELSKCMNELNQKLK